MLFFLQTLLNYHFKREAIERHCGAYAGSAGGAVALVVHNRPSPDLSQRNLIRQEFARAMAAVPINDINGMSHCTVLRSPVTLTTQNLDAALKQRRKKKNTFVAARTASRGARPPCRATWQGGGGADTQSGAGRDGRAERTPSFSPT